MAGKKHFMILVALAALAVLAGCSGDDNNSPTAIDTAPPSMPSGVSGRAYDYGVTLSWDENSLDADFAGFKVYRTAGDAVEVLVGDPQPNNWFMDTSPVLAARNEYRVTAVDFTGNESSFATVQVYAPTGEGYDRENR